jgi:hypothetical protein
VLWFDDNPEFFSSLDLDDLEAEIRSWGFVPNIIQVTTPDGFNQHSPFEKFDIIVVDYNLEEYGEGQDFIERLRAHQVFTEVIFYSSGNASVLWDAIRDKKLEGVFVDTKPTIQSKIIKVGQQAVRKVLDLENMRGIVMAEVGELDRILDEIFVAGMESLSQSERDAIFSKFYENAEKQVQEKTEALLGWGKNRTVEDMLCFCDSDKRWQNYRRLSKRNSRVTKSDWDYPDEVLRPRNFLAHGKPKPHPEGGYTFSFNNKDYLFDESESRDLRQRILKYKEFFSEVIMSLKQA